MSEIATRTAQCRHGVFTYHSEDRFLGASLRIYGEWSEDEVRMYDAFLKPTDVVIEVGANIGALTVPLSRRCKEVFAFEPQPQNYELLCKNLSTNGIHNVSFYPYAIGAKNDKVNIPSIAEIDEAHGVIGDYGGFEIGSGHFTVEQRSLDNFKALFGHKIAFIKMDCEGSELEVLKGAEQLIKRDWPLLYIENDKKDKSASLIEWLVDNGYHCYWHRPPLYREDNYRKYVENLFGDSNSINMICCRDRKRNTDWLREEVLV
jgi:FkbM family methyltransferase